MKLQMIANHIKGKKRISAGTTIDVDQKVADELLSLGVAVPSKEVEKKAAKADK